MKAETYAGASESVGRSGKPEPDEGKLASVACSLLLKGTVGRAACAPGSTTSSESPSDHSVEVDVQLRFHDEQTHGIYTSYPASENDRVDW